MAPSKQATQAAIVAIVAKARSARLQVMPTATEAKAERKKINMSKTQPVNPFNPGANEHVWALYSCFRCLLRCRVVLRHVEEYCGAIGAISWSISRGSLAKAVEGGLIGTVHPVYFTLSAGRFH